MKKYIIIFWLLTSCVTENRCFEKYGYINKDGVSVLVRDTVIVSSGVRIDTAWVPANLSYKLIGAESMILDKPDTFIVEKEKLRIQMIRVRDTIRLTGHCKPDTFIVNKTTITRVPEKSFLSSFFSWYYLLPLLIIMVTIFLFYKLLR